MEIYIEQTKAFIPLLGPSKGHNIHNMYWRRDERTKWTRKITKKKKNCININIISTNEQTVGQIYYEIQNVLPKRMWAGKDQTD